MESHVLVGVDNDDPFIKVGSDYGLIQVGSLKVFSVGSYPDHVIVPLFDGEYIPPSCARYLSVKDFIKGEFVLSFEFV